MSQKHIQPLQNTKKSTKSKPTKKRGCGCNKTFQEQVRQNRTK